MDPTDADRIHCDYNLQVTNLLYSYCYKVKHQFIALWNLAVNCQYNIRLGVRQAHDRHSEAHRHFPLVHIEVQLLMTAIADHHVVDVWACTSSKTPTNHSCSQHQFSSGFCEPIILSVSDSWCLVWCICVEKQNIDYEFWPDMSKISYCTLGKFLLHTYQFLLHTLWRNTLF